MPFRPKSFSQNCNSTTPLSVALAPSRVPSSWPSCRGDSLCSLTVPPFPLPPQATASSPHSGHIPEAASLSLPPGLWPTLCLECYVPDLGAPGDVGRWLMGGSPTSFCRKGGGIRKVICTLPVPLLASVTWGAPVHSCPQPEQRFWLGHWCDPGWAVPLLLRGSGGRAQSEAG